MADRSKKTPPSLDELEAEFEELWRQNHSWNFGLGRLRVSAQFNSMRHARYFVGFHLVVLLAGTGLIFLGGSAGSLGQALVVGALFGFGAFIAQVWALQTSKERSLVEDRHRARLAELEKQWDRAIKREALEDEA